MATTLLRAAAVLSSASAFAPRILQSTTVPTRQTVAVGAGDLETFGAAVSVVAAGTAFAFSGPSDEGSKGKHTLPRIVSDSNFFDILYVFWVASFEQSCFLSKPEILFIIVPPTLRTLRPFVLTNAVDCTALKNLIAAGGDDLGEVREYFNNVGFDRWNKVVLLGYLHY
jgi:hypothetical protein